VSKDDNESVSTGELDLTQGVSPELSRLFLTVNPPPLIELHQTPSLGPTQAIIASRELHTTISTSSLVNPRTQKHQVVPGGSVTLGSKLVAQLPRLQQGYSTHISLLPSSENDKWVRMVWNKDAQDTYSIHDYQSPHLPSIIHRRQGTIENVDGRLLPRLPPITYRRQGTIEDVDGGFLPRVKRPRLQ
jgi:hypothetical protein